MARLKQIRRTEKAADDSGFALKICWACLSFPGLAVMGAFFVFPMAILAVFSFVQDGRNGRIIYSPTIQNYVVALGDPFYLSVLGDTILLGVLVSLICLVLAYPVSYFLARSWSRWRAVLIVLALAPLMISAVVRNIGWIPLLGEAGGVNQLLLWLGIIPGPLMAACIEAIRLALAT